MSDNTFVALGIIAAIPGTISTVLAFIIQFRQNRNHNELNNRMADLKDSTNGRMDELLKVTGASEHAKGVIEGQEGH
jgi:hypothetical protein